MHEPIGYRRKELKPADCCQHCDVALIWFLADRGPYCMAGTYHSQPGTLCGRSPSLLSATPKGVCCSHDMRPQRGGTDCKGTTGTRFYWPFCQRVCHACNDLLRTYCGDVVRVLLPHFLA